MIQWYPGHMVRAQRQIKDKFKLVDAVMHLLDARAPESSRNPLLEEIAKRRPVWTILNKEDLADPLVTRKWLSHYQEKGWHPLKLNSRHPGAWRKLQLILKSHPQLKDKKQINLMVVGVPNVGKSTLINRWIGRKVAKTGDRPALTQEVRWLKGREQISFLDTPGVLWPKFDREFIGYHLGILGSIKAEILSAVDLAGYLMNHLIAHYPRQVSLRYKIAAWPQQTQERLLAMGKARGFYLKGAEIDLHKAAESLIRDFQLGRLGRVSLDLPA